ncbi:MAG: hypothetical protein KDB72_15935 [Mycobacterium sp.]|nr:hypothetical protein [Mycobacterium sp.]
MFLHLRNGKPVVPQGHRGAAVAVTAAGDAAPRPVQALLPAHQAVMAVLDEQQLPARGAE